MEARYGNREATTTREREKEGEGAKMLRGREDVVKKELITLYYNNTRTYKHALSHTSLLKPQYGE